MEENTNKRDNSYNISFSNELNLKIKEKSKMYLSVQEYVRSLVVADIQKDEATKNG